MTNTQIIEEEKVVQANMILDLDMHQLGKRGVPQRKVNWRDYLQTIGTIILRDVIIVRTYQNGDIILSGMYIIIRGIQLDPLKRVKDMETAYIND